MENYVETTKETNEVLSAQRTLLKNVYCWMALALVVTGLTSYYVASSERILSLMGSGLYIGLLIAEVVLVVILSARIHKMSFAVAGVVFVIYSILNGVTLSVLLLVYTFESIALAFFITAGTFTAMALIGHFTKKDLSSMGQILLMALIGLIIATVVNLFIGSSTFQYILSYVGVLIFVGLTAYDAQKIKNQINEFGTEISESTMKLALMGALELYLDFINLMIYILRIVGSRRD
ncbi:MAG: Bax inhibitor-1/YccA family protein [Paludibacteraceae bacterium]|nr:Bax inhibitor-1/YccA family protein [Paludibacteraceae bacterium]MBR5374819.1 Bax inhibitor-1/YccA family protein [Paludibacteraceae bacterium]